SLILLDRYLFLKERRSSAHDIHPHVLCLFESTISPRNLVLLALKNEPVVICEATEEDAPGIVYVMESAWPEEKPSMNRITRIVADNNHCTMVAKKNNQLVGFVDAFMTVGTRWEVDLLAVHPQHRRLGIAKKLLQRIVQTGKERHALSA